MLKFGDPASIAAAAAAAKPIEQMYVSFGKKKGKQCGDCAHFRDYPWPMHCAIYRQTGPPLDPDSSHVDFLFDTPACGKWEREK